MDAESIKEQNKYSRMWEYEGYSGRSPGLDSLPMALALTIGYGKRGDTVVDFGCGRGLVLDALEMRGFKAYGIDLVKLHDRAIVASLWDLPKALDPVDYGLSFDVLEHLPTDRVPQALQQMSRLFTKKGFFQICMREDSMGSHIGEKLHLTVQDKMWWVDKLTVDYDVLEARIHPRYHDTAVFIVRPKLLSNQA